jgi:hypothetical protein
MVVQTQWQPIHVAVIFLSIASWFAVASLISSQAALDYEWHEVPPLLSSPRPCCSHRRHRSGGSCFTKATSGLVFSSSSSSSSARTSTSADCKETSTLLQHRSSKRSPSLSLSLCLSLSVSLSLSLSLCLCLIPSLLDLSCSQQGGHRCDDDPTDRS